MRPRQPPTGATVPFVPIPSEDPARSTTPQRSEATGVVEGSAPARTEPYRNLKMPHERDESTAREKPGAHDVDGTRAVTRQAADDVQAGQQDTDRYNAAAPDYKARERKGP